MKVLFVCRQSVGRSQMAKAFYNSLTHSTDADAAGINVREAGQTLLERKRTTTSTNFFVLDVMNDAGIDISLYTRTPLTQESLDKYDVVISMLDDVDTPTWLAESPHYRRWAVKDPRNQDYPTTAAIRDDVKSKVIGLIEQIKNAGR